MEPSWSPLFGVNGKHFTPQASFLALSIYSQNEEIRKKNGLYSFSNQALADCLRETDERNITCLLYFACSMPFERRDDLKEMVAFQRGLKKKFGKLRIRTSIIEIEPCSPISMDPGKYSVVSERTSFADYVLHHSIGTTNHYQELGYVRKGLPGPRWINRFFCKHFCGRFKAGRLSPYMCAVAEILLKSGIVGIMDKVYCALSYQKVTETSLSIPRNFQARSS